MRLFFLLTAISIGFVGPALHAKTLSEDLFPAPGLGTLTDPGNGDFFDLSPSNDVLLDNARRNFSQALDILETDLGATGNYANILALAPELRKYAPRDTRAMWMHGLALAASGDLTAARTALAEVPDDTVLTGPLPHLAKAMVAFRDGASRQSLSFVEDALGADPDYAYSHNLKGMIEADLGDRVAAEQSFAKAAQLSGVSVIFQRNLGVVRFQSDQLQSAADALDVALQLAPEDCPSLTARAQVFAATSQLDRAEELMRRCVDARADHPGAVGYLIELMITQNRFEDALSVVEDHAGVLPTAAALKAEILLTLNKADAAVSAVAEPASETPEARLRRAMALAMSGDVAQGLETLTAKAEGQGGISPSYALVQAALSVAAGVPIPEETKAAVSASPALVAPLMWFDALHIATQDAEAAAVAARRADGLLPGVLFVGVPAEDWQALGASDVRPGAALAMLWLLREYDMAAQAEFDRIVAKTPSLQARYFGALADVRLRDVSQAVTRLTPVSASAPSFYSAQVLLGELNLNIGAAGAALENYRAAVKTVEDGGSLMKIGLIADALDEVDVAEDALRRFIDLYPDVFIGYNQLAWLFVQRETRLDEALTLTEKANQLKPGNGSVLDNLGWILHLQGDTETAAGHLREANRLTDGANPDILYHLAVVEAALGQTDRSLALLDTFDQVVPEGHNATPAAVALRSEIQ